MRPLFADTDAMEPVTEPVAAPVQCPPDRTAARREERYLEWRRNRVVFMRQETDRMRLRSGGDLPPQRGSTPL